MVTGAELMLFTRGFFPDETLPERLEALSKPTVSRTAFEKLPTLLDSFLTRGVDVVRVRFGGHVTYASLLTEPVNWEPFDSYLLLLKDI
ncbi:MULTISPECIES: hypothetical protein [Paenibacillus]|uniref:hypothetical protein n=1 Tax=Paenibacillus TaxID=44249 RepID=UPI00211641A4|nr:hypothetical protein [Paenibacillus lautus]